MLTYLRSVWARLCARLLRKQQPTPNDNPDESPPITTTTNILFFAPVVNKTFSAVKANTVSCSLCGMVLTKDGIQIHRDWHAEQENKITPPAPVAPIVWVETLSYALHLQHAGRIGATKEHFEDDFYTKH